MAALIAPESAYRTCKRHFCESVKLQDSRAENQSVLMIPDFL